MNENNTNSPSPLGGSKLSTIFLVVLGLHIVLIVAFSAYHLLKGDSSVDSAAEKTADTSEVMNPPAAPVTTYEAGQPTVETQRQETEPPAEVAHTEPGPLPMPASNDPIWTRVPAPVEKAIPAPLPSSSQPAAVAPPAGQPRISMTVNDKTHTVAKGDSLARIARTHGVSVADLKKANNMAGDLIKIGQILQVPSVRMAAAPAQAAPVPVVKSMAPSAPTVRRAVETASSYTVGKGDTLWKIARQFNVKPQELAASNGITDPSKLKVGMVLRVPQTGEKQDLAKPPVRAEVVPVNTDMAMVPR